MQWEFDDTPISIWIEGQTRFNAGSFAGRFAIDDVGGIEKIWLDEHVWPHEPKGTLELRRWKPGMKDGFKQRLFDALARSLEKAFEAEINECLADIHGWPTAAEERQRELAIYHQQVL